MSTADRPVLVVNLRGDDVALFRRVHVLVESRAGPSVDVPHSSVIRAALLALLRQIEAK